jgi:glutamate/tyrosine decarboxylase-like PLP-dependent enzyme
MSDFGKLYAADSHDLLLQYLKEGSDTLATLADRKGSPRLAPHRYSKDAFYDLVDAYSDFPEESQDPKTQIHQMVSDLYVGIPRWRSPRQQYNVGTAVNAAASAAYSLALDESILNVNDGLAGNTLVAEQAVTNIIAGLAKLPHKAYGIFTFGGTATNMYGMKIGLKKAHPDSSRKGLRQNVKVFVTAEAHFSHLAAADWLGIGVDNIVKIKPTRDRSSDLEDLETKLRATLDEGDRIGVIIINGGTTYDHIIDDIPAVVKLRDKLVKEYTLDYVPHLHVDTVIGWGWLVFEGYNWKANPLHISVKTLAKLKHQYDRIKYVRLADSWGIDFHKGIGGCPVDCSMVIINKFEDAMLLSRKTNTGADIHQLADEYSFASPVDYTLETSRSSGAPLAALTALRTLGREGYRRHLANLVEQSGYAREKLSGQPYMQIANDKSNGFTIMLRLLPPEFPKVKLDDELKGLSDKLRKRSELITRYTKEFFTWDFQNRLNKGVGPEYSFSKCYFTGPNGVDLNALKFYPVSPLYSREHADELVDTMTKQQKLFNETVWQSS